MHSGVLTFKLNNADIIIYYILLYMIYICQKVTLIKVWKVPLLNEKGVNNIHRWELLSSLVWCERDMNLYNTVL